MCPRPRAGEWDRLTRLPADLRRALLADPETVERYHAKVYRRGTGLCWYWLGALSGSGHMGALTAGRSADPAITAPSLTHRVRELADHLPALLAGPDHRNDDAPRDQSVL